MHDVQIKRLNAHEVSKLLRRSRGKSPTERIKYLGGAFDARAHTYTFFVAFKGKAQKLVGCAMLAAADNGKPDWVCTRFISVDPACQGHGIGRQLNEAVFQFCAENGLSLVSSSYTEIGAERLKAMNQALSKRFGVPFEDPDEKREAELRHMLGRALTPAEVQRTRVRY